MSLNVKQRHAFLGWNVESKLTIVQPCWNSILHWNGYKTWKVWMPVGTLQNKDDPSSTDWSHTAVMSLSKTDYFPSKKRIQQDFGDRVKVGRTMVFLSLLPSNRSLDHPWHRKGKGWFQEGHHLGLSGPSPEQDTCATKNFCCLLPGRCDSELHIFGKHASIPFGHLCFSSPESTILFLHWLCVCSQSSRAEGI